MILFKLTSSLPRILKATISVFLLLIGFLIPPSLLGQVYQAEDAVLSGPAIFSGQGASTPYADFQSASGDYIEWTIPSVNAGSVTLSFVYQLGASADRPLELKVNGVVANPSMSFPSTGSWQTWDTTTVGVTFQGGNNTVRLTAIGSSGGNFDFLIAESICPPVLFSGIIHPYAGTQDNGTATVLDNQATLLVEDNAWKAIDQSYMITANTVIEFDFKSTQEGEEHAIGFNSDLTITNNQRFKLYGTQNTAASGVVQDYNNYAGAGNYQHYSIPVGQYYTGQMEYLFFVCDNDASPSVGDAYFSNVLIYEDLNQNGQPDDCGIPISVLGPPSIQYFFNFSDSLTAAPSGWERDYGLAYGLQSNGLTYGWVDPLTNAPVDLTALGRNRVPTPDADVWRETLLHLNRGASYPDGAWEIALPNGEYRITVQVGDAQTEGPNPAHHIVRAEGTVVIDLVRNVGEFGTRQGTKNVTVTDGKLTIDGVTGNNTKIQSLTIESTDGLVAPIVLESTPADGSEYVSTSTSISANFIDLPNTSASGATSIDNPTITSGTVQLYEITANGDVFVQGSVNGTGGGDAINFTPASPLKANTSYRYVINGVKDLTGTKILPFSAVFHTDTATVVGGGGDLDQVAFINGGVVASGEKYTTLTVGPDDKLYGITISGEIHRWIIAIDGTLNSKETLVGWKTAYAGSRTAVGLTFDPTATSSNLIAYVSHCSAGLSNAPEWDGKISRLSGADLATEELLVTNLPRSIRDHLTNSMEFRPGEPNVLYFLQGSNSAGGAADGGWGNRPERLLTAAFLRLDLSLLPATLPLDAQTSMVQSVINAAGTGPTMSDGTYNPYGNNVPLTLYATGIRNAYDFVWHSNGQAYIAANGTAGGSLSPASVTGTRRIDGTFYNGPVVPAIGPNQTQRDFLFRVDPANPLGYYGHPNPLRGEYVLNRGFDDEADYDPTLPADANYRGFAFDFEFNKSPNGILEYKSASNGGHLQGAMLVCRYSGGSDLIALVPDGPNGDILTHKIGIAGFTGFQDPLDITEDVTTGNIYVSDYGTSEIILLKPGVGSPGELTVTPDKIVENTAVNSSKTFSVTVGNIGGSALGNVQLALSGDDAAEFSLTTSTIATLAGGASNATNVVFSPTSAGPKFATLTISAPGATTQTVDLRGIGTSGEPSLQWILDAHLGEGAITVGDDNPANNIIHSSAYAAALLGDEIAAQAFTRVDGTNPVTIEVLSVFGPTASNPITAFGWYETGNPSNNQELFTIGNSPASNGQTVNAIANGSMSFNPNAAVFGFFNRWPFFNNRILYSEDAFNTFSGNLPHHIRVYPLPGEANAYVVATEEHIAGFDFQDIVVIVRNVSPFVSTGAQIAIQNRILGEDDVQVSFPSDEVMVFHRINTVTTHDYHDKNVLRISNPGIATLLVSNLVFSDPSKFIVESIVSQTGVSLSTSGSVQVPAGEYVDVTIQYVETGGTKGIRFETLSLVHNVSADPTVIQLNAAYM
ncbi:MAG: Ig-like domain-containing protein, partial [Bacteroidia bacterium]|nr:Ig-like domain-containing protein [Bacteroidia bacterium]